ncbi:uncharacterized protein [Watersipora subatra]|uniref:uncharacterized protein isoform X2 n=1 Tax=Watersipora subatra TaxID=2589382 RepID=UPI00355C398B
MDSNSSNTENGAETSSMHGRIAQMVTRNGQIVCQASCSTTKEILNADVTLEAELAQVQNQAHKILNDFTHDNVMIEGLFDIIRKTLQNGGVVPPECNDFRWPSGLEEFIDSLRRACEIQVNESESRLVELMNKLVDDVEATISCVEISIKFPSKRARFEFLQMLLKRELPQKIAKAVFDEKFCALLSTPNEVWLAAQQSRPDESQKGMLQGFLERICDLISVRITFQVDQLISKSGIPNFPFKFNVSAANLMLPHHDTERTDKSAMVQRIQNYLKQDADLFSLIGPFLTESLQRRISGTESE